MNDIRNTGSYKNLENQLTSILKNTNENSYKTKYRYYEASKRLAEYLVDSSISNNKCCIQSFKNLRSSHLIEYTNYMRDEKKLSPAMIKTEIAGIRWFHKHSGSKNVLIDNSQLNLVPREYGKTNRAWLPQEIQGAIETGKYYGRMDFVFAVKFSLNFSLRLEEICNLRVNELQKCLTYNELKITGKGGRTRYVPMTTIEQKSLVKEALSYAKENHLSKTDRLIVDNVKGGVLQKKKSLENFLHSKKHMFIQSDRQKYIVGNKIRSETLTMHGLRATYAQNYYKEIKENNPDISDRKLWDMDVWTF